MQRIKKRSRKTRRVRKFARRRSSASQPLFPPVMRIAHRGASGLAPENTIAAIDKALEIGVDLIEIDVHLSADGHPVVIHDRTLERTTNGTGRVDTKPLDRLKKLDAGSWFGSSFKGERIPTLEEVIDHIDSRAVLLVEAKTEEAAEGSVTVVRSLRAQSKVIMQSFLGPAVRSVNRMDRRIPTAFLMTGSEAALRRKTGVVKRVLKLGANALSLNYKAIRPDLVAMFVARAMGIWVWTVDDEDEMKEMVELGVGGIITNYPDRLNNVLETFENAEYGMRSAE